MESHSFESKYEYVSPQSENGIIVFASQRTRWKKQSSSLPQQRRCTRDKRESLQISTSIKFYCPQHTASVPLNMRDVFRRCQKVSPNDVRHRPINLLDRPLRRAGSKSIGRQEIERIELERPDLLWISPSPDQGVPRWSHIAAKSCTKRPGVQELPARAVRNGAPCE